MTSEPKTRQAGGEAPGAAHDHGARRRDDAHGRQRRLRRVRPIAPDTGTNSASSRAEARSADIQIAHGTVDIFDNTVACGTYVEDLTTGIITATDMVRRPRDQRRRVPEQRGQPPGRPHGLGHRPGRHRRRLHRRRGVDRSDLGGDQAGELSPALTVAMDFFDCEGAGTLAGVGNLAAMETTPIALSSLAAGRSRATSSGSPTRPRATVTTSQSDTTTWKFAFDATATYGVAVRRRWMWWPVAGATISLLLPVATFLVAAMVLGWRLEAVQSGSMEPTYPVVVRGRPSHRPE